MRLYRRHLGPRFSEGARLLWEAMGTTKPADFERSMGWSVGMLSRFLYGERLPGRAVAAALLDAHGIPLTAWDQKPTVPFIPPAARLSPPDNAA